MWKPEPGQPRPPVALFSRPDAQRLYEQLLGTLYLIMEQVSERKGVFLKPPNADGADPQDPLFRAGDCGANFIRMLAERLSLQQREGTVLVFDFDGCGHALGVVEEIISHINHPSSGAQDYPPLNMTLTELQQRLIAEYDRLHPSASGVPARPQAECLGATS